MVKAGFKEKGALVALDAFVVGEIFGEEYHAKSSHKKGALHVFYPSRVSWELG